MIETALPLIALGINHQSAPIAIREKLAFSPDDAPKILRDLCGFSGVQGAILLSTCNRTEFYLQGDTRAQTPAISQLLHQRGLDIGHFAPFWFARQGESAVRHVFRVATGLDSLVLGEPQILGQLKQAYQVAKTQASLTPDLERMLQSSFAVAKHIRSDTGLGENSVSIASSAIKLSRRFYDDFEQRSALIIGAGETAALFAKHLRAAGIQRLLIANRTLSRAQALAHEQGGLALPLADIGQHLRDVDLIVCATSSTLPVLRADQLQAAIAQRRRKTLLLIDLGVPRNFEPACANLRDCYLYSIDDLKQVAEEGQALRKLAALDAEITIDAEVQSFMSSLYARHHTEPVLALRKHCEAQADAVLAHVQAKIQSGVDTETLLKLLHAQMLQKFLHQPTLAMKDAVAKDDAAAIASYRKLFGIEDPQ